MHIIRPTGRDLSIKNTGYQYLWYPLSGVPHTASQTEKDMMEWTAFAKTCEVMRLLEPYCPATYKSACSEIAKITSRLGIGSQYEGRIMLGKGNVWEVGSQGRHYSIERSILRKFRADVLKDTRAVAALAANPDLRDLLDLDPTLTKPANFALADTSKLRVDGVREDAFVVDSRKQQPALNAYQASLLRATHEAHHAVSAWRKDPIHVPKPPDGIVQRCHDAFEASALDETQLHFFAMKPFSGVEHPSWSREELGLWASVQDVFHHRWMDGILAGNWRVRESDSGHLFAHLAMNFGRRCWPMLFPGPQGSRIDDFEEMMPEDALPILCDQLGIPH